MSTTTETLSTIEVGSSAREGVSEQFLTFQLGSEIYAVDILRVQEIRSWDVVTKVPNTPEFVLGVLNIRGTVIPIIDLRARFDLDPAQISPTTVVIVVRADHASGSRIMGLLVDAVSDVLNFTESELRPSPDLGGSAVEARFVRGLASRDRDMITILDIDSLLNSGELAPSESSVE